MLSERTRMDSWSAEALAYFRSHAISADVAAGCGVTEHLGALRYPNAREDGRPFWRERRLDGRATRQPSGVALVPWWPDGRSPRAVGVLVTEGESDALAALTAIRASRSRLIGGIAVVAVPGTGYPADKLAAHLAGFGFGNAWLAYDADEPGRTATKRAKLALAKRGVTAREVHLPDGKDLADCLADADDPALWLEQTLMSHTRGADELSEGREAELLRKAGAMKRVGFDTASIIAALDAENHARQPVLDVEVMAKLARAIQGWKVPPSWLTDHVGFIADDRLDHDERFLLLFLIQRLRANGTRRIGTDSLARSLGLRLERVTAAKRGLVAHGRIAWKGAGSQPGIFRVLPLSAGDEFPSSVPPPGTELLEPTVSFFDPDEGSSAASSDAVGRSEASSSEAVGSSVPPPGTLAVAS